QGGCLIAGTVPGEIAGTYTDCGGTLTQTWTFTDGCERTITHTQNITITPAPQAQFINTPDDITISCAEAGTFIASDLSYTNEDQGGCLIAGTVSGNIAGSYTECGGTLTQTWTFTDECERTITHTQNITVTPAPQAQFINTPDDITISCAEAGTFTASDLSYTNEGQSGCLIAGTVTGDIAGTYTQCGGELIQTWTFTDECERTITHTQTITVIPAPQAQFENIENISISCEEVPNLQPINLPYNNGETTGCSISGEVTGVITGEYIGCNSIFTQTWSFTDNCGRTSIQTQTITVIDNTPPTFTLTPENLVVECDGTGNQTQLQSWLNSAIAIDNCSATTVTNNFTGLSNECGLTGSATVTFTATNECGLTATATASFTIEDTQAPSLNEPNDIIVTSSAQECGAQVNIPIATATDGCGTSSVTNNITGTNNASGFYPVGTNTIIWTATDECGNTSTEQTIVTVLDDSNPVINCPADITVDADEGVCEAYIDVPQPEVTDNCEIRQITNTYTHTDDASGIYHVGTTTVWWTAVDWSGNIANCSMTITVNDTEDPIIDCPEDITVDASEGECSAFVTVPVPVTSDNCGVSGVTNSYNDIEDASGIYPVGSTNVVWTVTDMGGRTATCSTTITVVDNTMPVIECTGDITVNTDPGLNGANLEIDIPVASDNCGVASLVNDFNSTNNASGFYPIGITTVTWTVTDTYGNTSSCSFNVTVTDSELPTIVCPGDVNNFTDPLTCGAYVAISKPEVFDNVGILSVINDYNQTDDASDDYPVGTTEVIWFVTDLNGNTTTCTMTVTISDNVAPEVVCPEVEDIIATEACTADVVIPKPEVSDNCGITSIVNNINFTDDASGIYPVGTTSVIWTITDIHANVTTCTTTVHVSSFMIAEDDNASTQLDTPVVIDVIANDSYCINEIDQASLASTSNPVNGTIMADPINGSFIYTPNAGYSGTDTFSYSICNNDGVCDEAVVTITVESPLFKLNASNDEYAIEVNTSLDISNLTNDSYGSYTPTLSILDLPQHGTIMKSDNNVRYIPDTDYIGSDSYKYILSDINNQAIPDTAICFINIIAAPVRDTLIIYNVITPDGDGRNDTWWIDGIEENADNEVLIFNRWGDQVQYFENYNNNDIVWNGTNRSGDPLPNATYYYIVKLRTIQKVYTGWVVIHGHE
ncbi:MAG: HYR domain-containing protein, partial [Omnitrophica WOR_2 bacterium]